MSSKTSIEKVRIFEKDFPVNIPDDLGDKPLEVVSKEGELLAIFFNSSCMINKPKDLEEFIQEYDVFFDQDLTHLDTGLDDYDEEKEWMEWHPNFDKFHFSVKIKRSENVFSALCRLTYPYHLSRIAYEDCFTRFDWWGEDCFDEITELAFSYGDINIIAKIVFVILNTLNSDEFTDCLEKYFILLYEDKFIYNHADLLFTRENIDRFIEIADKFEKSELKTYLLDYKNTNIS
jgi:hypothetical protein